jgi:RNA polymerase sigma-B factor
MTEDKRGDMLLKPLDAAIQAYLSSESQQSLDRVMQEGHGIVKHFAYIYSGGRYNEDILQAGYEGFLKALDRFDETRGNLFSTFAGHYIIGEIRHYIRKEATYYKPNCISELQGRYDRVLNDYYCAHGSLPTLEYMAEKLNIRPEGIANIMSAGLVSFDQLNIDQISNMNYKSFRLPIEDKIVLDQAMKMLTDIQRKVIILLFFRDMTQVQVAEELGMNQRKVSRILHSSLDSLRTNMISA